MIKNFKSKSAWDIYDGINSKYARKVPKELHERTRRLLDQVNAAPSLRVLSKPPSNRLEKLSGKSEEYWSLRINNQWRIVFYWKGNDASDLDVIDYH